MNTLTASQVAECLLAFCNEHGDCLTNLKLQKLLYYAQGWHLGLHGTPLFGDKLEAWIHGPVVPSVYREYRDFGHKSIETELTPDSPRLASIPKEVWDHIAEVWSAYGSWTAYDLERLSHKERPWSEARGDLAPDTPSNNPLSNEVMGEFFATLGKAN